MQILIIGAGDIGFYLSKRLSQENHDITMIEGNPQTALRASEQLDAFVLEGNGASYQLLKQANLAETEIVAAMTDSDEANLLACRLAKKAGVKTTIARVRHPQFTQPGFILTPQEMGLDFIIHPEKETADSVLQLLRKSAATYAIEFEEGRIELLGVRLEETSPLLNIPLKYLGQETDDLHLRIVAINRDHHTIIPNGEDLLRKGDQVFVVADHDYSSQFISLAGRKERPIKDVMILGGGLISRFIAQKLVRKVNIKIIERNLDRARQLADILPQSLIIHGDGTDFDLLEHEGLSEMDAFISVTGNDEMNIIATLLAQQSGVGRSIALINKGGYLNIAHRVGLETVVSKQSITVNAVERYIHQHQVASMAGLPGIGAQLIEYIASEGCQVSYKELKDIEFPANATVGAVLQGDELIVPHGDTHIKPGDKVVVFALPQALGELERLFENESSRRRISKLLPI
ncbi:MAG: Trk system potassium transporter TrkA [Chloroflexota bacterium]